MPAADKRLLAAALAPEEIAAIRGEGYDPRQTYAMPSPTGSLTAQEPANPVDRIGNAVTSSDWYRALKPEAQRVIRGAGQAAEFTPPVAAARGGYDIGAGMAKSDALQALGGAVNAVPEAGKVAMAAAPPMAAKSIRAFHGSPHDFDRFSMEHIGKGEGAQVYGHGLYFAENEDTAKFYRDKLGPGYKDEYRWKGRDLSDHQMKAQDAGRYVEAKIFEDIQLHQTKHMIKQDLLDHLADPENSPAYKAQVEAGLKFLDKLPDDLFAKPGGHMYEVEIAADPKKLLDWDKRLSEQSPEVREAVSRAIPDDDFGRMFKSGGNDPFGWRVNEFMADAYGSGKQSAADRSKGAAALREAGIPGISYLDQGSRAAGEGTRNYVIWDDSLVKIARKYGLPMTAAGAATAAAIQAKEDIANQLKAPGA